MEIKIVITDGGSAGGQTAAVSFDGSSGSAGHAAPSSIGTSGDQGLLAQERAGAINAGPAPSAATFGATGSPAPFIAQREANVLGPTGVKQSTDESGGAAPGSGAEMETFTTEAQNG